MVLQTEVYNGGYKQHSYSSYQGPTGGYTNYSSEFTSPYSGPFQVSGHGPYHQSSWSGGGSDYFGSGSDHFSSGGLVAPVKTTPHGYEKPHSYEKPHGYESSYFDNSYAHVSSNSHAGQHVQVHGSPKHQGHESPKHHGHGSPHNQGHGSPHGQGHGGPHNQGYGSPQSQGHGGPHNQGYGNPQGYASTHGQGHGGLTNQGYGSPFGFGKAQALGGAITSQINKFTHGHTNYGGRSPNYGHPSSGFNHGYHQQPTWTVKSLDDDE